MIVVDASAILEILLKEPLSEVLARRLAPLGESLHAPHLLDLEVAQVLRRFWALGDLDSERVEMALGDLLDLQIERYAHDLFLPRIWELRHNVTAYDAAYVALAEALSAPLLTADQRLARSSGHHAEIELLVAPP